MPGWRADLARQGRGWRSFAGWAVLLTRAVLSPSKWSFAWALYAGVGYQVTKNVTVELAYRYLDLGDGRSGDIRTFDGTNNVDNPMHFRGLTSHDVKLGIRVQCCDFDPPPPPPLVRKG